MLTHAAHGNEVRADDLFTPFRLPNVSTLPRILMLTQRFPYPPNRGDRIRAYHLLKALSLHFDVSLACTTDEPITPSQRDFIQQFVRELAVVPTGRLTRTRQAAFSVALGHSLTEGFFHSSRLARTIRDWHHGEPFRALLVFCSSMFSYSRAAGLAQVPQVVDLVDVDSQKWAQLSKAAGPPKKWLYGLEARRVRALEQRIASQADSVVLTSPDECELFARTVGNYNNVHPISNGVDTDYFRVPGNRGVRRSKLVQLVFTGVMDYAPNVEGMLWFCREILPAIRRQVDVQLKIVGRRPTPAVRALSANRCVEVVGEVPDVRPYLDAADIAVSPLQLARGIQNKVLEAMASGLPVVATQQSAEGIDAEPGRQLRIAHDAQEFVTAVVQLAQSPELRASLGTAARCLVEQHYSWPARLAQFRVLLDQACHEPVGKLSECTAPLHAREVSG